MDIFKFLSTLQHKLGLILIDDDTDLSRGAHRVLLWADQQISHALSMTDNKQDWRIDHSAGRPILVYQNCSVIEAEQAEYVLRLIKADKLHAAGEPSDKASAEAVRGYTTDQVFGPMEATWNAALEEAAAFSAAYIRKFGPGGVATAIRALKSVPAAEDSEKGAGDVLLPEPAAHLGKFPHKVSMYTADQVQAIVRADRQQRGGVVDERAAFEAAVTSLAAKPLCLVNWRYPSGDYKDDAMHFAWRVWQARAALSATKGESNE